MMNMLFNFDARWDEVLPHLNNPLVQRALNAGMESWCQYRSRKWEPERGPWYYSQGGCNKPQPNTPDWYRCLGRTMILPHGTGQLE